MTSRAAVLVVLIGEALLLVGLFMAWAPLGWLAAGAQLVLVGMTVDTGADSGTES